MHKARFEGAHGVTPTALEKAAARVGDSIMLEGAIMPIMVKREGYVTSARYTYEEWIEK